MAVLVLIMGESGTGKTRSFKDLPPEDVMLFKVTNKPLPFKSTGWKESTRVTHDWERIAKGIRMADKLGKKIVIIDDFQYILAEEYLSRSSETGFSKFTEMAVHVREVIRAAQDAPDHIRVYITWHSDTDEFGKTRAKTIGKLLNEKICIEGLFTIVLKSQRKEGRYCFSTQTNGFDVCKSPEEMFDNELIDNDLLAVDKSITKYYEIEV